MSLIGALQTAKTSLAAAQAGVQTAGNNISNANTAGYTRQTVRISANRSEQISSGVSIGTGATLTSIDRQVSQALQDSLRTATSDDSRAQTYSSYLSRLESTFNAVGSNDLGDRMTNFFNQVSTLANNPSDSAQGAVVVQTASSLASYIKDLRSRTLTIRSDVETQISQLADQANTYLDTIASLNVKIATSLGAGGNANDLMDQRDQALNSLSELMDVNVIDQGNGMVNVLSGSTVLVQGSQSRGLTTTLETADNGEYTVTRLVTRDKGDSVSVTGGEIAALTQFRDNDIESALSMLNNTASSLINTVNGISSLGQGVENFSTVTSTEAVNSNTTALNALTTLNGKTVLPSTPKNGSFVISEVNSTTGEVTSRTIDINFDGTAPTTLTSLAASLTSGNIKATANADGTLTIESTDSNTTFSFSDDTSGVLAALGINTIFTGKDASNIGINQTVVSNPSLLATGRNNVSGDNTNAQALVTAYTAANSSLGGVSLQDFYNNYVGTLATTTAMAKDDASATSSILTTVQNQREAYSGVSTDEETINLMNYQRMYQGTARYLNVVNELMDTVMNLVS